MNRHRVGYSSLFFLPSKQYYYLQFSESNLNPEFTTPTSSTPTVFIKAKLYVQITNYAIISILLPLIQSNDHFVDISENILQFLILLVSTSELYVCGLWNWLSLLFWFLSNIFCFTFSFEHSTRSPPSFDLLLWILRKVYLNFSIFSSLSSILRSSIWFWEWIYSLHCYNTVLVSGEGRKMFTYFILECIDLYYFRGERWFLD